MRDVASRPLTAPGMHAQSRVPRPTAPAGTMLYLVQLAHCRAESSASYPGNRNERKTVLELARTHASVLLGMPVNEHQRQFVASSPSPWDVLLTWIERALRRPVHA